ncbi:GatB/YqeY domain-containing protein [Leptolyngbya sp. NIES-2104]|uniref:GatB/YqeY domain-containing protein n=1 Tax=Leptolyngbya sp. NIES-2104 TaxID=1552121 RepID=UPI0006ECAB2A|nr:GatB/YqeY domain-containing protein [Leptolyngbya sp. NIES-2104]GAP95933.1 transamidase GatB domain protein [Leptolyngbya sp. NIES-2104]
MSLKDRITEEIKTAMKSQDKVRLETLRSIKKVLLEKEVSVRPSGQTELTEAQEIEALSQIAKQRRDSIEQYTNANRSDLADKEAEELAIIETFLPAQMSDEEVESAIAEIITQVGATSAKDMGKVMGPAMQQLKGKADGKKVQAIVKAKLGG